jgi:hypothetical protein
MIASYADFALHSHLPAPPGLDFGVAGAGGLVEQVVLAADRLESFGSLAQRLPGWLHVDQTWLAIEPSLYVADHVASQVSIHGLLPEHRARSRELVKERDRLQLVRIGQTARHKDRQ